MRLYSTGALVAAVSWFSSQALHAQPAAVSKPAGVHKVTFTSGATFFSTPLHGETVFTGTITARTANTVTFAANPNWPANTFAQVTTLQGTPISPAIPQFVLMVQTDSAATPGVQGDWWLVASASGNTVTVNTLGQNLSSLVAVGSTLEIRRLVSIRDLFGSGVTMPLTRDSNFDLLAAEDDFVRSLAGTGFNNEFFYHDGSVDQEGWYYNGNFAGDGSLLRFAPTDALMLFRRTGAPSLTVCFKGQVQTRRLSSYLVPGANPTGAVFPINAPIGGSNLKDSGWISDVNFDILASEDDFGRAVVGTSFGIDFFHYAGPDDVNGWYVGGNLNNNFPIEPTRGYMLFRRPGAGTLIWRQNVPFTP
jgi:uncharacterized protein (TIGR02597 family)